MKVLVINSGSSSVKAQLMETKGGKVFAKAYCQKIGLKDSFMTYSANGIKKDIKKDMPTHKDAFKFLTP